LVIFFGGKNSVKIRSHNSYNTTDLRVSGTLARHVYTTRDADSGQATFNVTFCLQNFLTLSLDDLQLVFYFPRVYFFSKLQIYFPHLLKDGKKWPECKSLYPTAAFAASN